ncbi:MAG: hypothetical protein C0415_00925 [Thermodesulfovibrio sp.]|nr:hypothetical protein [Thermodesulfovibrio sp.]
MPFNEPFRATCFTKQYDYLFNSKFPKSKNSVKAIIDGIIINPLQGDRFPGFGQNTHIRKLRIGLKEYHISKRDGLRLIWLLNEDKKWILMVSLYHEREYKREQIIQEMIRDNLRSIISYIETRYPQSPTSE